jgi:hypothetical protein
MDELRGAQERAELGWDRQDAMDAIASSIRLLKMTTQSTENHLTEWLREREEDWTPLQDDLRQCADEWLTYVRGVRREEGSYTATVRDYYHQLNKLTSTLDNIGKIIGLGPEKLVKMAKDLAVVTEKLMTLSLKVNQVFDQLQSKGHYAESLEDKLTAAQLQTVLEWVQDNDA